MKYMLIVVLLVANIMVGGAYNTLPDEENLVKENTEEPQFRLKQSTEDDSTTYLFDDEGWLCRKIFNGYDITNYTYGYDENGILGVRVEHVSLTGVYVEEYMSTVISEDGKKIFCFNLNDVFDMYNGFTSYVRPILEEDIVIRFNMGTDEYEQYDYNSDTQQWTMTHHGSKDWVLEYDKSGRERRYEMVNEYVIEMLSYDNMRLIEYSNTKIDGGKVQRMQYDITEDDTGKYYVRKYGKDSSIMYRYEDSVLYKNIIYDNDGNLIKEEQYDFEIAR